MNWKKIPNCAMYNQADWSKKIKTVTNCSEEKAKQIAESDSSINFFFLVKEDVNLNAAGFFLTGTAVFFGGGPVYGSARQCDSYEKVAIGRKNQKDMTTTEWQNFKDAIERLKSAPTSNSSPNYQQFVDCHINAMTTHEGHNWGAHGGLNFLTWHRAYLKNFEARLREFNQSAFIPYWNWAVDRAIPTQLSNAAEWGVTRNSTPDFSDVATTSQLDSLLPKTSFSDFSEELENYHGSIHNIMGGQMSGASSPADPLFWLHHCFIDKLFADWQRNNGIVEHPNPDETLQPPPFVTGTNAHVWSILNLGYNYV